MSNIKLQRFIDLYKGKKAAVIGVGISNRPLIRWLVSLGINVTAFDKLASNDPSIEKTMAEFKEEGIDIEWSLGEGYLDRLGNELFDIVFKTPKMRVETPELLKAKAKGSVITSEMELFMTLCPAEIYAVTGSDGKTTTTTLISELLKNAGYNVWLGGNIGTPLLDKIASVRGEDKVVLELSSFQLLSMKTSADISVVTNITPNHLDFHKDYDEYISSKKNIFLYQSPTGKLILNGKCDITFDMRDEARGKIGFFALDRENTVRSSDNELTTKAYTENGMLILEKNGTRTEIIHEKEILIPGKHNVENYLAAISAVCDIVPVEVAVKVAKEFKGVAHRIEFIRELEGVRYYNSSIDTSPNRTINTMNALSDRGEKGVLICGGADKKCDYTGLGEAILKFSDRIVIYGSNAPFIRDILAKEANGRSYEIIEIEASDDEVYEFPQTADIVKEHLYEALIKAKETAREGELVIMSNIGTSYDHFRHFEHRGDLFRDLVNSL